jgi:meckelin
VRSLLRFDISSLGCEDCTNAGTAANRISDGAGSCKCSAGFLRTPAATNPDALSFTCGACTTPGFLASLRDNSLCVACDGANSATFDTTLKDCKCANTITQMLAERDAGGTVYSAGKRCIACPSYARVLSGDPYACVSCPDTSMTINSAGNCVCSTGTTTADPSNTFCVANTLLTNLNLLAPPSLAPVIDYLDVYGYDGASRTSSRVQLSYTFNTMYTVVAIKCQQNHTRPECQALANLCALQQYATTSQSCSLFRTITTNIVAVSNSFADWKEALPYLLYSSDTILTARTLSSTVSLKASAQTATRSVVHVLAFKLVTWYLNGTMHSISDLSNQLQVRSPLACPCSLVLA